MLEKNIAGALIKQGWPKNCAEDFAREIARLRGVIDAREKLNRKLEQALLPFEKFTGTSFDDGSLCTIRVYARELRAVAVALKATRARTVLAAIQGETDEQA